MFYKKNIFVAFLLFCGFLGVAQEQTIRGKVIDQASGFPIAYASVQVVNVENKATVTDEEGNFVIENVPVGKVDVLITSIQMRPVAMKNIELLSGKELVLNVQMQDDVRVMDEVVVKSKSNVDKRPAVNKQALVAAKQVKMEQVNRFAGSLNDISRMVMNMTGVKANNDANNDIVIRGNSPAGLLWRMNDVDIPNPNHFGSGGATGGAISMLNTNLLATSDFFTAAFVPEYANALSGVFDLNMRKGSLYKSEFLGQISANGIELLAEAPIKKGKSSFFVNYRYSFLGLMQDMGVSFGTGTAVPEYQDLSFNLYSAIGSKGQLSFFGLGGMSNIFFETPKDKEDENVYTDKETTTEAKMGIMGLQYRHQWTDKTFSKSTIAISRSDALDLLKVDENSTDGKKHLNFNDNRDFYKDNYVEQRLEFITNVQSKLSKKHTLKFGGRVKQRSIEYLNNVTLDNKDGNPEYQTVADFNRKFYQAVGFTSLNTKWTNNFQTTVGLTSQYFNVTDKYSFEPRVSMRYQLNEKNAFGLGYGFHTQVPFLLNFAYKRRDGSFYNSKLDYKKSHHFVASYTLSLPSYWNVKLEGYFQNIINAPRAVYDSANPYTKLYSTLNDDSFTRRSLTLRSPYALEDGAKGQNYGIELTVERSLHKGFYMLSTLSLFNARYKARDDEKWRNTTFNGNYVYNALVGKQWNIGSKGVLSLDLKATYAGGNRYIAVDLAKSKTAGGAVYDFDNAYDSQISAYFRPDIRAGFKVNGKKVSQEWAIDIQNFINKTDNVFGRIYNEETQKVEFSYQRGLFPVGIYRIYF